jgi:hypothetical protein
MLREEVALFAVEHKENRFKAPGSPSMKPSTLTTGATNLSADPRCCLAAGTSPTATLRGIVNRDHGP